MADKTFRIRMTENRTYERDLTESELVELLTKHGHDHTDVFTGDEDFPLDYAAAEEVFLADDDLLAPLRVEEAVSTHLDVQIWQLLYKSPAV